MSAVRSDSGIRSSNSNSSSKATTTDVKLEAIG